MSAKVNFWYKHSEYSLDYSLTLTTLMSNLKQQVTYTSVPCIHNLLYASVTVIAQGVLLPPLQANTVAVIIFGGVKRIARFSEVAVPFMAIGYIVVCFIILGANASQIPHMFTLIVGSALGMDATFGGIIGAAISWGIQRGLYSNAAGVGSEIYGAAAVEVSHPAKQGLVQSFAVYVDTLIVYTATGFMILITGMYNVIPNGVKTLVSNIGDVEPGTVYTQRAIESVLPSFGSPFIAIAVLFFAFTTMVAYYYSAETCLAYVLGEKNKTRANRILKVFVLGAVFYGSVNVAELVWGLGDLGLGSMGWINIIVILFLSKKAFNILKDYETQKKAGKDPVFEPTKLGITGADYWEKEYKYTEHYKQINEEIDSEPKSVTT